jgi:hypothetical protein
MASQKRHPVQRTFEAGVVSPLMYSRAELPGYPKSLKNANNMIVDYRGPVRSRGGFEYQDDVADPTDTYGRLFTYRASSSKSFVVAITPTSVWITDSSGFVEGVDLMLNGNFEDNGTSWTEDAGSGGTITYPSDTCRLSSGTGPEADNWCQIEQSVAGLTGTNIHKIDVDATKISTGLGQGQKLTLSVGTTLGDNDLVDQKIGNNSAEISFLPNVTEIFIQLHCESTKKAIPQTPPGTYDYYDLTFDVDFVTLVDVVTDPDGGDPVTFASPYTEDQLHDVQAEMAPDLQRMTFVHKEVAPQKLEYDIDLQTWSFGAVTFVWAPDTDPWTATTDFPGAITYFQGRQWLAGTRLEPVSLWASEPGSANYDTMLDGSGLLADDALKFVLATNADIHWMKGSSVLFVGCDNSEHIITSDGPAVIPADNEVEQKSAYGSMRIKTDWVSEDVAFVSFDQRRFRIMDFEVNSKKMSSADLTYASEHLTIGRITEMQQVANPLTMILTTLANGTFLTCTYDKQAGVSAWTPHSLGDGTIVSMTVVEENGASAIYALIYRDDALRLGRMSTTGIFMDEYVNKAYGIATNTVDELDHLEGKTVQVIGDGSLYPDAVVASGEITTVGPAATEYVVGLPMSRSFETMNIDDIRGGGSSAPSKKSWNRVFVRLLDSGLPLINGVRPPDRTPITPMDEREENVSKDVIAQNVGWDYDGTIVVAQDLPLELIVTGVFGELTEENM